MASSIGVLAVAIASDHRGAGVTAAAATLWQKMGEVGGSAPPQFLSTHPSSENRPHPVYPLSF